MQIAMIGAGTMGATMARRLRVAGHDVVTPVLVLASAVFSRFESRDAGDDAGKVLSAMRSEFGGHRDGCAESAPATEDQS